jgi:hypothetical protein
MIGAALASAQQITPTQMAECWEAFSLNNNVSELTNHTYEAYRAQLVKESRNIPSSTDVDGVIQTRKVKREVTSNMVTPPASKRGKTTTNNSQSSVDSVARDDLNSPQKSKTTYAAANVVKYEQRADAGAIVTAYVAEGISATTTTSTAKEGRCVVSTEGFKNSNVTKPYRHMFSSIPERAAALESHLVDMGREIIEKYGISDGENGIAPLEQVNVPRQDKICCVGRVCNEVG